MRVKKLIIMTVMAVMLVGSIATYASSVKTAKLGDMGTATLRVYSSNGVRSCYAKIAVDKTPVLSYYTRLSVCMTDEYGETVVLSEPSNFTAGYSYFPSVNGEYSAWAEDYETYNEIRGNGSNYADYSARLIAN